MHLFISKASYSFYPSLKQFLQRDFSNLLCTLSTLLYLPFLHSLCRRMLESNSARSHPHLARSYPNSARSHPQLGWIHPHLARYHPIVFMYPFTYFPKSPNLKILKFFNLLVIHTWVLVLVLIHQKAWIRIQSQEILIRNIDNTVIYENNCDYKSAVREPAGRTAGYRRPMRMV
jgi:hypothetical protein